MKLAAKILATAIIVLCALRFGTSADFYDIAIISAYLPAHMSDLEAASAISALMKEIEAETIKDMGRTMAALKQRFAGQMDFAKAGALVKKLLAG